MWAASRLLRHAVRSRPSELTHQVDTSTATGAVDHRNQPRAHSDGAPTVPDRRLPRVRSHDARVASSTSSCAASCRARRRCRVGHARSSPSPPKPAACGVGQAEHPGPRRGADLVETDEGPVSSEAVIVATNPPTAAQLVPSLAVPAMNSVTTWYHSTDDLSVADGDPILHVDAARRGPVINSVVVSHAVPAYAPTGRALVATSTLGTAHDAQTERAVSDPARDRLPHLDGTLGARRRVPDPRRLAGDAGTPHGA